MPVTSNAPYLRLDSDSEKDEISGYLSPSVSNEINCYRYEKSPKFVLFRRLTTILPWLLSFFFASLSSFLAFRRSASTSSLGSYEQGFETDISKFKETTTRPKLVADL
jgi:hypothetical protein